VEPVVSQLAEYLESLLEMLACPLDNSIPLSAVRNTAGEVVALSSSDAEYPVVHNVPCLIPELGRGARGDLPLWQAHQKKMWQEYQAGEPGVFTGESNEIGRHVGEIIAGSGCGLCLDVGCGARPWPVYMASSSERVRWIGVDPFFGDAARRFPFVQGLGEYLPFRRGVFGGALYASTIYHQLDPQRSLRRVRSVLRPMGKVFVWYTASRSRRRYWTWRGCTPRITSGRSRRDRCRPSSRGPALWWRTVSSCAGPVPTFRRARSRTSTWPSPIACSPARDVERLFGERAT